MKRMIIKQMPITLALCALMLSSGLLHAQTKVDQLNSAVLLKKANIAYRDLKFAVAADYYETCLQNMRDNTRRMDL